MNRFVVSILCLAFAIMCTQHAHATEETKARAEHDIKSVSGLWYTEDKEGIIELYPCEGKICGRFFWVKDETDGSTSLDTNNPDPEKQNIPLCGMKFMWNFTPDENGEFHSGCIYSPRHGSNFNATLRLVDTETLILHGYFILPIFGENQTWTKAKDVKPCEM